MTWKFENIPDQTGRVAIVTGANAGIGYEAARALAKKGARVILACRNRERGAAALEKIAAENPAGSVELSILDLSSLDSVQTFADEFIAGCDRLDLLINNAGVMIPPESKTADGFELQIGVNFLGHFALTGHLLELLEKTQGSRVVTVSSIAHRNGRIDFDSFKGAKRYRPWKAYGQSKLACLMFTLELQRRLDARGSQVRSLGAHPGGTKTDLQRHSGVISFLTKFVGMSAEQGALPTIYAATEPEASGGEYIGPHGLIEARGYPTVAKIAGRARDQEISAKLWQVAEEYTGVSYLN